MITLQYSLSSSKIDLLNLFSGENFSKHLYFGKDQCEDSAEQTKEGGEKADSQKTLNSSTNGILSLTYEVTKGQRGQFHGFIAQKEEKKD